MSNIALNFNEILNECGVETEPPSDVLKKIAALEEFYDTGDLSEIYDYILLNVNNYEILIGIIKLADSHKTSSTLQILSDMLLSKNIKLEDEDEKINLRALCAKAISNYKDTGTVTILLSCLNNKNENYKIRLACADALGRIGDKYAVAPLIDVVKDEEEKSIYVIQYPESELSVSYGILDKIYEDKIYNFNHKCSTNSGSSGSPVLTINNKLIGIHKEGFRNYNKGTFLNYPLKEFIQKYKNEILLKDFNIGYNTNIKNTDVEEIDLTSKKIGNEGLKDLSSIEFKELKN